jgi:hypothetical protein
VTASCDLQPMSASGSPWVGISLEYKGSLPQLGLGEYVSSSSAPGIIFTALGNAKLVPPSSISHVPGMADDEVRVIVGFPPSPVIKWAKD